ncbi:hypothetical protein SAMN05216456_1436 [Devosia crocina]|uniref:TnsA endonuclease N terminal n=1 Tax=Devosia crocina TaxID=429728 RepID=A0A1I7NAS0_9HYPH|nr:hypothetical protein [Devosia crocina]SFV31721.1 hypothetical protein SAMN05216456_1436 [Devosia crocina]
MPKEKNSRRYLPAPQSPYVTVDDVTGIVVRGPLGMNGIGDDRDPFAHQIKPRQKGKHKTLRGSEARVVRTRGASLYSGVQPIQALGFEGKAHESGVEGDFWLVADYLWPDMTDARAQPGKVEWFDAAGKHTWYPDAWIRRPGHIDLLVECKLVSDARPEDPVEALAMRKRLEGMRLSSEIVGMRFGLYTELEIRSEPRFHNAKAMRRALTAHIGEDVINDAASLLKELPEAMSVLEFSYHLGPHAALALNVVCILERLGAIAMDRRSFFLPETMFRNLWPERD